MTRYYIEPGGKLSGEIHLPGDKSISHRAVMLGAIADGITEISGLLEGEDVLASIEAFRAMGVNISSPKQGKVWIQGVGKRGLKSPLNKIDCGNSGTSMRLLAGLLAGQGFAVELVGDESLMRRPMRRVADPLNLMGARIETAANGCPPLKIYPSATLHGLNYILPVASAQIKSSLLLAGLYAHGDIVITEPHATRDHTERMLAAFGHPIHRQDKTLTIRGEAVLRAQNIQVPGDLSSAAFFIAGAAIAPGSDLLLRNVGINPTRSGVIDILRLMGADITIYELGEVNNEPRADIRVRYAPLRGVRIPVSLVSLAIDEFPAILVAAAHAEGKTILSGAEELRVKESDRIAVMAEGLHRLGLQVANTADGMQLIGADSNKGGEIESYGDHRPAMAFAIAGLKTSHPITVLNCANVATSFPGFAALAREIGLRITELS